MIRRAASAGLLIAALILTASMTAPDVLRIGAFSEADPADDHPPGWTPLSFQDIDNRTEYRLVRVDSTVVVRAESNGGASGLVRRQQIDPHDFPIMEWRWKVNRVLDAGDASKRSGDDYPARIYVTFAYDDLGFGDRMKLQALKLLGYSDIPTRALNYLWASRAERGQIIPNAYTDWVMMLPVESGPEHVGQWRTERRNVLEDYREAFGEDPPMINGVAIMTDTDDTGESATAYYGDIVFKRAPGSSDAPSTDA
jgi:hypothetical protein